MPLTKVKLSAVLLARSVSVFAPPEVVARYGAPPGTGKISPRQGIALPTEAKASPPPSRAAATRTVPATPTAQTAPTNGRTPAAVKQGLVLYVDTTRVADGRHTLRFVTEDAAGNWNTADTTIYVDNHAPVRPTLSLDPVDQPGSWAHAHLAQIGVEATWGTPRP